MKLIARITSKGVICLVSLCLFILGSAVISWADNITIGFNVDTGGNAVADGTDVSSLYADWGVTFLAWRKDYGTGDYIPTTPLAFADGHSFLDYNVIGAYNPVSSPEKPVHYLSTAGGIDDMFGVAIFTSPTDYVQIFGIGGQFRVNAFDSNNIYHGPYNSTLLSPVWGEFSISVVTLDNPGYDIGRIQFAGYSNLPSGFPTYFDNLTFNGMQAAPLPTSVLLLGLGLISLVVIRRRS